MKTIKEIVMQASEYLPEDIEFGLVRELEKRESAAVHQALDEAAEKAEVKKSEQLDDEGAHVFYYWEVDKASILSLKEKY